MIEMTILGKYEIHFKIAVLTAVLALFFAIPAAMVSHPSLAVALRPQFSMDLELPAKTVLGLVQNAISLFALVISPLVFSGLAGILLSRNLKRANWLDIGAVAVFFSIIYLLAFYLSDKGNWYYWTGEHFEAFFCMAYVFVSSFVGNAIGRYVSDVVK